MKVVKPHEYFYLDFNQIIEEARRQEEIHPANKGEQSIASGIHRYLSDEILPLIVSNPWVFDGASDFVNLYANDCFNYLKLGGQEVYKTQVNLELTNQLIVDFIKKIRDEEKVSIPDEFFLKKGSDFTRLFDVNQLSEQNRLEALRLHELAIDHEDLQTMVALRSIRDNYETTLPRIMYVIRRGIKINQKLKPKPSDNNLTSISEYIDWYKSNVDENNPLFPVIGRLDDFYRIARNVASHHTGFEWMPDSDQVILRDRDSELRIHVYELFQRNRYLVHLSEFGVRGILAAFCERDQGKKSNELRNEYLKTFPEDFPDGEPGKVELY